MGSLIDHRANINCEDSSEGITVLMLACRMGYLELVSYLLERRAEVWLGDQRKRRAIFYAIDTKAQNVDVVRALINVGAKVNEQSLNDPTPLVLATKRDHADIVRLLL